MPQFVRIGVHQSNVSGYTSKAWWVRRVGSTVFLKWGAVEVHGVGDGRKIYWTLPPRYAVEKDIRGRHADERRTARQQRSRPLIDALEPWLRAKLALISQKSKLAVAIRYALSRWEGLTRFIDDDRIELDNNAVERSIRPIALNRKNALFAGSDGGAE